ncbi:restriction endonuclease subunit R [Pannus brasiliensis CCIBt3594]|uniref:Restriction endonuclease subunit R n=1 Tax=Pannus brasiliensis CCIBt3594 TaxID=1427578 RepID=A0AAW9QMP2_9CHRO
MKIVNSRNVTMEDVHFLFKYKRERKSDFTNFLSLEPLSEFEEKEIEQIREDFESYLAEGSVSEGQIKFLEVAPLLRLSGFYQPPIKLTLEENIFEITLKDEDTTIWGRIDVLAVNKTATSHEITPLWLLIVEAKNSEISPSAGLAQLLTYAFKSLQGQSSVWGLLTNGEYYQFIHVRSGEFPVYHILPSLNFLEIEPSRKVLQVLKAILRSLF